MQNPVFRSRFTMCPKKLSLKIAHTEVSRSGSKEQKYRFGHSRVLSGEREREIIHKPKKTKLLKNFKKNLESLYQDITMAGPRNMLSEQSKSHMASSFTVGGTLSPKSLFSHRMPLSPKSYYGVGSPKPELRINSNESNNYSLTMPNALMTPPSRNQSNGNIENTVASFSEIFA